MDSGRRRVYSSGSKRSSSRSKQQMVWMDQNAFLQWQMLVEGRAQGALSPALVPSSVASPEPIAAPLPEPKSTAMPSQQSTPDELSDAEASETRSRRSSTSSLDSIESWATANAFEEKEKEKEKPVSNRLRFAESAHKHDGQLKHMLPRRTMSYTDLSSASDADGSRSGAASPPARQMAPVRPSILKPAQIQVSDVPFSKWTRTSERVISTGGSTTPSVREIASPLGRGLGPRSQLEENPLAAARPPLRTAISATEIPRVPSFARYSMDQARPMLPLINTAAAQELAPRERPSITQASSEISAATRRSVDLQLANNFGPNRNANAELESSAASTVEAATPTATEPQPQPEPIAEPEPAPLPKKSFETSRFSRRSMEASRAPRFSTETTRPPRISIDVSKFTSRMSMDVSRPRMSMEPSPRQPRMSMDAFRSRMSMDVFRSKDKAETPRPGMPIAAAAGSGTDTSSLAFRQWGPPTPAGALPPTLAGRRSMSAPRISVNLERSRAAPAEQSPPSRRSPNGGAAELVVPPTPATPHHGAVASSSSSINSKRSGTGSFSFGKNLKGFLRSRTKSLSSMRSGKGSVSEPVPEVPPVPSGNVGLESQRNAGSSLGTTPDVSVTSTLSPVSSGIATPELLSPQLEPQRYEWNRENDAVLNNGLAPQDWRQLPSKPSRHGSALGVSVGEGHSPDWPVTPLTPLSPLAYQGSLPMKRGSLSKGSGLPMLVEDESAPVLPARSPMRKMNSNADLSTSTITDYRRSPSEMPPMSDAASACSIYSNESHRDSVADNTFSNGADLSVHGVALSIPNSMPGQRRMSRELIRPQAPIDAFFAPSSPVSLRHRAPAITGMKPSASASDYSSLVSPNSAPAKIVPLPAVKPLLIHKRSVSGSIGGGSNGESTASKQPQQQATGSSLGSSVRTFSSAGSNTSSISSSAGGQSSLTSVGSSSNNLLLRSPSTLDPRKSTELLRQMGIQLQQQQEQGQHAGADEDDEEPDDGMEFDQDWH